MNKFIELYILINILIYCYCDIEDCISGTETDCDTRKATAGNKCIGEEKTCTEEEADCNTMDKTKCNLFTPTDSLKKCSGDGTNACSETAKTCEEMDPDQCNKYTPSDSGKICSKNSSTNKCKETEKEDTNNENMLKISLIIGIILLLI